MVPPSPSREPPEEVSDVRFKLHHLKKKKKKIVSSGKYNFIKLDKYMIIVFCISDSDSDPLGVSTSYRSVYQLLAFESNNDSFLSGRNHYVNHS